MRDYKMGYPLNHRYRNLTFFFPFLLIYFPVSFLVFEKSEARRDATPEWYIPSWKQSVFDVIIRSCLAFSAVKPPGENRFPAAFSAEFEFEFESELGSGCAPSVILFGGQGFHQGL